MAGIELFSTPPSSTRQWTPKTTGSRSNSTTVSFPSRSLSPRHFPLPLSPPASLPERVQFEGPPGTVATDLKPARASGQSVVAHCMSPRSHGGSRVNPRSPPPRPARPPTALSNIRPTIILSPFLVSSLPPADRPLLSHSLNGKQSFSTSSTSPSQPTFSSKSSTSDSRSCYSSLAPPSPCFFGPTTWPTRQLPASSSAEHTSTAPSLPPRSPRRPTGPNLHPKRPKPTATTQARSHHRRKTDSGSGSGSASASSRSSHIPSPHPPSPPPFPPPTTPLPPTPTTPQYYINTTSNSESSLPSPVNREKQPLTDSPHYQHQDSHQQQQQHHPLIHGLAQADADSTLALAPSRASSLDAAGDDENNNDTDDDNEEATRPRPWRRQHKRHLWMLSTAVLVAVLVGGILGGIIWKLGRGP